MNAKVTNNDNKEILNGELLFVEGSKKENGLFEVSFELKDTKSGNTFEVNFEEFKKGDLQTRLIDVLQNLLKN